MKVMVGLFTTESNANVPGKNEIGSYDLGFGDDCVRKLRVGEVFQAAGIDVIPSVYASAGASGVITRETFDYIESLFVRTVKEHLHEIDGIYLHLHGASEVEGLGSGDHHILAAIRMATCARNMWTTARFCAATANLRTPTRMKPNVRSRRCYAIC